MPKSVLVVAYPAQPGGRFDHEYYLSTHVPLVTSAWTDAGLEGASVVRGVSAPDGGPSPFTLVAQLTFSSAEAMQAALGGPRAAEVFGDIANFTDTQPVAFVAEPVAG